MEDDQEVKHMCKFCYKSFPCGRSLGGHMRSHMINVPFDQNRNPDEKFPKKKLPPLNNPRFGNRSEDGDQFGAEKSKRTSKLCKQCGKSFQSWKALFGHMKCHSVNGKAANSVEEDSWNSSNHDQKLNTDNQSDGESATFLFRKKRSERMKRYNAITKSCSFNIVPNFSPCVSEIDQKEEEEVALSLILLSRDTLITRSESSDNSSEFLQAKGNPTYSTKSEQFKSLANPDVKRNPFTKMSKESGLTKKIPDFEQDESEVNSPRNLIKKRGFDHFESDFKKEKIIKRKSIGSNDFTFSPYKSTPPDSGSEIISKFSCTVCKKAFASYQALGGHRASHKKFNGCCAPTTENIRENQNQIPLSLKLDKKCLSSENVNGTKSMFKKNKDHECPVCFRVFPSGQALGGHKRSHLVADQARVTDQDAVIQQTTIPEIREFLDLNLPAPDEEEFKSWWIEARPEHEPILGLLST